MPCAISGPSTRRADGRRNKQRILDAAVAALLENPQVSISEIAERAGLTRATVYRHYPDREVLVSAVAARSAAEIVPRLLDAMRPLPWPEALDLLARQVVTLGSQHREVILTIATRLEESARSAVEGEPIQAELAVRRAAGQITSPLSDEWLALSIRALCLAAISRLVTPQADVEDVATQLAGSLRRLCC